MAMINVRVDDGIRDDLKELADSAGVTLSEFVRMLVLEAVRPVEDSEGNPRHGDEPALRSLDFMDRKVLSMLHRILARVLPEDSNDVDGDAAYQLERAQVLENGYTGEYWMESAGFWTELSAVDSRRVVDILQMFRILRFSLDKLEKQDSGIAFELARRLEYQGFDHNDSLELHMASYVNYLVDDDRWTELKPAIESHDNGNSHMQMLPIYLRMLDQFRRIMHERERSPGKDSYLLDAEELVAIADARIHPSHR